MPLVRGGRLRKRWRYVGVYGPEVMLCAARARIGPLSQSFWAVWDRKRQRRFAHTRALAGHEVAIDGSEVRIAAAGLQATLHLGDAVPVEAVCPSGERGYGWTRKRAAVPVTGTIEADGRRWQVESRGVDDESAGYHERHTSWRWSAGVGTADDGRAVAWINDPERASERAIWIDGVPSEPEPVGFEELGAVRFSGGARLDFRSESERVRDDNLILLRSRYRHCFGTFSGSLDGIELDDGFGVMEEHEALW
jgi:hypothetical protein